jgi:AcrR family transcriptional regulator
MLTDGLLRLLTRKEFADISIQEVAVEATLNRATFYRGSAKGPGIDAGDG